MVILSACLAGVACGRDGQPVREVPEPVLDLVRAGQAVLVCPEQLGGLPSPRPVIHIEGGTARDVLAGRARLVDEDGHDVTHRYLLGVERALQIAKLCGAQQAVFRAGTCCCALSGPAADCWGVLAGRFQEAGIACMDENSLPADAVE